MNWLAEYRNADAEGGWLACGKARTSIEYAKADARQIFVGLNKSGRAEVWEFRLCTTRGDVYQVCSRPTWWRLQWSTAAELPSGSVWRGEYRSPGDDWSRVGEGGRIEQAVKDCQDWHSHSVHSDGVFRIVQGDVRGSIWLESHPPHPEGLRWGLPR